MGAAIASEDDVRDKIKTFMTRMDQMESRVKDVETVAASVRKLEKKLLKVESQVESRAEPRMGGEASFKTPPPVKAFISGASIGVLVVGSIAAAWLFGFF
jgi:hypothetical protein